VLGAVLRLRGDWDAAMAEYERAFDLNQNSPDMLVEWADFLSLSGRANQAVTQVQRAMTLKRIHPDWYIWMLDRAYYNARQYEEAIRLGKRLQNPRLSVLENITASYAQLGRHQEAARMIERILAIKPDHSIESFIADNPVMEQGVLLHLVEGLRKAGLPEK
jgi:tetratricopeptide (TPR) repeat protein